MIKKILSISAIAALLFPLALSAQSSDQIVAPEMPVPGNIKVIITRGDVTLINNDSGESKPLKKGDIFRENTTIVTGAKSACVIVLSNGSSLRISENTEMDVAEFKQGAYDPEIGEYFTLTADPSVSNTRFNLKSGSFVGETKKLNPQSTYAIDTPIGSAGIRGTKFGTTVEVDGETYTVTFAKQEGGMTYDIQIEGGELADGESITVTGTVDADGNVTINNSEKLDSLPEGMVEALEDLETETQEFDPPGPPAPTPQPDKPDDELISPAGN